MLLLHCHFQAVLLCRVEPARRHSLPWLPHTLATSTTNLFTRCSTLLPTTSYLKMFDIWLIICQLVPFIEVRIDCDPICFHSYI